MLELNINGQPRTLHSELQTPFIYVLRNELGLMGTKQGCSQGQCGACTILVNGKALRACETATETLIGKDIITIEGLKESLLQDAFIAEQAAQCGYCISGILMRAAALLKSKPKPSRDDIKTALNDHLCRCGSHNRIIKAIQRASQDPDESPGHV